MNKFSVPPAKEIFIFCTLWVPLSLKLLFSKTFVSKTLVLTRLVTWRTFSEKVVLKDPRFKKFRKFCSIETKANISRQFKNTSPRRRNLFPHPLHLRRIRRVVLYRSSQKPSNPVRRDRHRGTVGEVLGGPRQYNFVIGSPANYLLGRGSHRWSATEHKFDEASTWPVSDRWAPINVAAPRSRATWNLARSLTFFRVSPLWLAGSRSFLRAITMITWIIYLS